MALTEKGTRTTDSKTNKTNLTFDFGNDFFNLHGIKLPWRIKKTHAWVDIKLLYKRKGFLKYYELDLCEKNLEKKIGNWRYECLTNDGMRMRTKISDLIVRPIIPYFNHCMAKVYKQTARGINFLLRQDFSKFILMKQSDIRNLCDKINKS